MLHNNIYLILLILLLSLTIITHGQYATTTLQFKEAYALGLSKLNASLTSNPDVIDKYNPKLKLLFADYYIYNYPSVTQFQIGIILDPCRGLKPDCCLNVFGTPEYPAFIIDRGEVERVIRVPILGNESEVSTNIKLLYESWSPVPVASSRIADDEAILDSGCEGPKKPYSWCLGKNYGLKRSTQLPACTDHNGTVNSLADCYYPDGKKGTHCVQVAYTSTTFIPQCVDNSDPHCGTFLEIHMIHGTRYQLETDVIADVRLDQRNVSGYYTTVIPLTWFGDVNKVLCSYTESGLRVGSIVYILPLAPVCCCPRPYSTDDRIGSLQCPKGTTGSGAFATRYKEYAETLNTESLIRSYPFCPYGLEDETAGDTFYCSYNEIKDRAQYTKPCEPVSSDENQQTGATEYFSKILAGKYGGQCPYFDSCGQTFDAGLCVGKDLRYTFIGRNGVVTRVDDRAAIPSVYVTFNDGRTEYLFYQEHVRLETSKSMYELWWVVRNKVNYVVQKKKAFNVTFPPCTFDAVNDQYFPYTQLDPDGKLLL
jgi:hypothetical protein